MVGVVNIGAGCITGSTGLVILIGNCVVATGIETIVAIYIGMLIDGVIGVDDVIGAIGSSILKAF